MSKAAIRLEKVKTPKEASQRERHNLRTKPCKSSDVDREHLNTYEGTNTICKDLNALEKRLNASLKADGKRAIRKDAVKLIEIIVSSDSNFFDKNDSVKYFTDSDEFLNQYWGDGNIVSKCIHMDEGTPHAHYFVTPIKNCKFNYSSFINGRDDLSQFQEQFYNFVKEKGYDIEERVKSEISGKKHEKTKDWSQRVQKAEMSDLLDSDKVTDYAIKGVMAQDDINRLYTRIESLQDENKTLRDTNMTLGLDNVDLSEQYNNLRVGVESMYKGDKSHKKQAVNQLEQLGRKNILEEQKARDYRYKNDTCELDIE